MSHNHGGKHWRRSGGRGSRGKKWTHSHAHVEGEEVHVRDDKEKLRRAVDPDRYPPAQNANYHASDRDHLRVRQESSAPVSATVVEVVEHDTTLTQYTVSTLPTIVSDTQLGVVTIPEESGAPIIVSTTSPAAITPTTPITSPSSTATESTSSPAESSDTGLPDTTSNSSTPTSTFVTSESPTASTAFTTSTASTSSAPVSSDTPTASIPIEISSESTPASSVTSHPEVSSTATLAPPAPPAIESPASSIVVSSFPTVPLPSASVQPSSALSSSPVTLLPSNPVSTPWTSSHPTSVPVSASPAPVLISVSTWPSLSSTSLITSTIVSSPTSTSTSTSESSTFTDSSSTSIATSETSHNGGNGRWGPTEEGYPAAPTDAADSPNHDSSGAATKPKIIGGVIGGVAGAALLLALLFFLLRLRKRRLAPHALSGSDRSMSETPFVAAAAAGATRLFDRFRTSKPAIIPPVATGERGFQKLGGRKLESVLVTGGDGYDDSFGVQQENPFADPVPGSPGIESSSAHPVVAAAGACRRQQSRDIEKLGSSQRFPTPPLGRPESQTSDSSGEIVVRPSPAHTPITSSADLRTTMGVSAATARAAPGRAPTGPLPPVPVLKPTTGGADPVGRTHPSANDSRASRFTEGF